MSRIFDLLFHLHFSKLRNECAEKSIGAQAKYLNLINIRFSAGDIVCFKSRQSFTHIIVGGLAQRTRRSTHSYLTHRASSK